MAAPIQPTEQLLREACERMARRFRWTESFEALMQDPARSRMVRLAVMHPAAAGAPFARPARAAIGRPLPPGPAGLPLFDRKRAASGERDDD